MVIVSNGMNELRSDFAEVIKQSSRRRALHITSTLFVIVLLLNYQCATGSDVSLLIFSSIFITALIGIIPYLAEIVNSRHEISITPSSMSVKIHSGAFYTFVFENRSYKVHLFFVKIANNTIFLRYPLPLFYKYTVFPINGGMLNDG